jgi:hypothetical protein
MTNKQKQKHLIQKKKNKLNTYMRVRNRMNDAKAKKMIESFKQKREKL